MSLTKMKKHKQKGGWIEIGLPEIEIFNLIRNIDFFPEGITRQQKIKDIDKKIQSLIWGFEKLTPDTPFKKWDAYFDSDVYVYDDDFRKILQEIYNIIITYDDDENVKYTNIGKAFLNLSCNSNNYKKKFIQHIIDINKVRVYNKRILLLKLNQTIINVIKLIGYCDYDVISRNLTSNVKLRTGKILDMIAFKEENKDSTINNTINLESVNLVRAKLVLLKSYLDVNIVSSKDLEINTKMNKSFWLENPAIIASMTALTNTFLSLESFQTKLSTNDWIKNLTTDINKQFVKNVFHSLPITSLAVAGILSGIFVPIATFGILATSSYIYNKINESDLMKSLVQNKELNIKTIKITDELKDKKLIPDIKTDFIPGKTKSEKCGLSENVNEYFTKFNTSLELLDDYLNETKQNYDSIVTISYNFVNIYSVICQDVLEIEPPQNEEAPIAQLAQNAAVPIAQNAAVPIAQNAAVPIAQNAAAQIDQAAQIAQNEAAAALDPGASNLAVEPAAAALDPGEPNLAVEPATAPNLQTQYTEILTELERLWTKTKSGTKKSNITDDEFKSVINRVRPYIKQKFNLMADCSFNIYKKEFKQILDDFRSDKGYESSKGFLCGKRTVGGKTKRSRKGKTQKRSRKGKTHKRR